MWMKNQFQSEYSIKTELTLALPGDQIQTPSKPTAKRGFSDLNLCTNNSENEDQASCIATQSPPSKAQVVGWPPVRSFRKKIIETKNCKYVKVAVDGAPYLRKLDLQVYESYRQLLGAFQNMFTFLKTDNMLGNESCKIVDTSNGLEYVPAYEDKDGDWMLVGDVPWSMFVDSCKRLRLIKSCEKTKLTKSSRDSSTTC